MKVSLLLFVVLFSASCFATDCQNFSKGKGTAEISFCVTDTGSIAQLQTNNGQHVLLNGAEGFAVCVDGAFYFDLGIHGDSGNWQPPVITQPNGRGRFPLTITRYSTDLSPAGVPIVIVSQKFSFSNGNRSVRVVMTKWGAHQVTSPIIRYADVVGDSENAANTGTSPFIWNQGGAGMMASPTGLRLSQRFLFGGTSGLLFGGAIDPCRAIGPTVLPYSGDSAIITQWILGADKKSSSQAIVDYIPMW